MVIQIRMWISSQFTPLYARTFSFFRTSKFRNPKSAIKSLYRPSSDLWLLTSVIYNRFSNRRFDTSPTAASGAVRKDCLTTPPVLVFVFGICLHRQSTPYGCCSPLLISVFFSSLPIFCSSPSAVSSALLTASLPASGSSAFL